MIDIDRILRTVLEHLIATSQFVLIYQMQKLTKRKKMEPTMNLLAICNFDMKLICVYIGVPERAHDTKVLTHCAKIKASFPYPPNRKYYLVDSGYPTRTRYILVHIAGFDII